MSKNKGPLCKLKKLGIKMMLWIVFPQIWGNTVHILISSSKWCIIRDVFFSFFDVLPHFDAPLEMLLEIPSISDHWDKTNLTCCDQRGTMAPMPPHLMEQSYMPSWSLLYPQFINEMQNWWKCPHILRKKIEKTKIEVWFGWFGDWVFGFD